MRVFKGLVLLLCMFLSSQSWATGKIIVGGKYFDNVNAIKPQIGFSIYEKILKNKLYLNAYAGLGQAPNRFEETTTWEVYKVNLDVPINNWRWVVSTGIGHQKARPWNDEVNTFELKASYRIW